MNWLIWRKITRVLLLLIIMALPLLSYAPATAVSATQTDPIPTPIPNPEDGLAAGKPLLTDGGPAAPPILVEPPAESITTPYAVYAAPVITVWHEADLKFGQLGNPQQWVNILGNVSPTNVALTYKLNGGASQTLSVGADVRRLSQTGDFNIELDYTTLQQGSNTVAITAKNNSTLETTLKTVTFNYQTGNTWPASFVTNWSTGDIYDSANVVDGDWQIESGKIRPQALDYDRLVAIGDVSWTDYQVTVPFTIHGIDATDGFKYPSYGPGVGMILRWQGHYQVSSEQPRTGWQKLGALGWYRWSDVNTAGLQMIGYSYGAQYPPDGNILDTNGSVQLQYNTEYIYKMNVTTTANGAVYRLKVWRSDLSEPDVWHMMGTLDDVADAGHPATGSMLLVAHHVDVSFGNVTVQPLSNVRQTLAVSTSGSGSVVIDPSGQTDYEFGSEVTLTAVPQPGYQFDSWSGDLTGSANPATIVMDSDKSVTATFKAVTAPYSDNYNSCTLTNYWTEVMPGASPGSFTYNGTQAVINVPGGSRHDLWSDNKNAPRLMQPAVNDNFQLEVKFDDVSLNATYKIQGIIVEESAAKFLRFDFFSNPSPKVYSASVAGGVGTEQIAPISVSPGGASSWYLRVSRDKSSGDKWTLAYSFNGTTWTPAGNFNYPLNVTSVGVFAGNSAIPASNSPAHTATIDYFHNNGAPGSDDVLSTIVSKNVIGGGTIEIAPTSYGCGDVLTVTAVPAAGYKFTGWSGALSGTTNPQSLPYDVGLSVSATFKQEFTLAVNTVGSGSVQISPNKATYLDGEVVTLTASPQDGWRLKNWSGDASGAASSIQVVMNGNKTITATFVEGSQLFIPLVFKSP